MRQSSESHIPHPQPLVQKIAVALAVVLVGHVGVLWAVSQIKAPELKPVEKKPIKVKMVKVVKIQELPPPPPPPPQVKKKEKPQVKEVKIVKKATPPPAKEVKKVVAGKAVTPSKPVNQPQNTKPVVPSTIISSTASNSNANKPTNAAPVAQPTTTQQTQPVSPTPSSNSAPPTTPSVINLGSGGVSWKNSPNLNFKKSEITQSCTVNFRINANEKGQLTSVVVTSSTCDAKLTSRVQSATKNARFYPHKVNGVAHPVSVNQSLTLNPQ